MNNSSKIVQIQEMYSAIGSAISNWTRVEIQIYQIFGAVQVLTIMQAGGGFSSDMRTPYAVLDTIDGFSSKMRMLDGALKATLEELDNDAHSILSDWSHEKDKITALHRRRNMLAHWTVASGFSEGAEVRLVPPPYSSRQHQGVSTSDIRTWEVAFIAAADRLATIVDRIASHQGLHRKIAMQTIDQVRLALPTNAPLIELIRSDFSNTHLNGLRQDETIVRP